MKNIIYFFFFFFQAEDGIRDIGVTGVQTCAFRSRCAGDAGIPARLQARRLHLADRPVPVRSEERRVGKSVDLGGRRIIKKKKKKTKTTKEKEKTKKQKKQQQNNKHKKN